MTNFLTGRYSGIYFFFLLFIGVVFVFSLLCVLAEKKERGLEELKRLRPFKKVKIEDDHALGFGFCSLFLSFLIYVRFDLNVVFAFFYGFLLSAFFFYLFGWFYWCCERIAIRLVDREQRKKSHIKK